MAILGGKNPHPQSTVVGGVTCGGELSADRLKSFRTYLEETRKFVNTVYIPDLKAVAAKYPEWTTSGDSPISWPAASSLGPQFPADLFMPRGMILNGDMYNVQALDPAYISDTWPDPGMRDQRTITPRSGKRCPTIRVWI